MTTNTKLALTYIGGILTGIILTFIVMICVAKSVVKKQAQERELLMQQMIEAAEEREQAYDDYKPHDGITLFDEPQEEMKGTYMTVYSVAGNGNATVWVRDRNDIYHKKKAVMLAKEGISYFDNQEIKVPSSKKIMVIGTFKDLSETLPVIDLLDK